MTFDPRPFLTLERPRRHLSWEKKEPRPSKDRGSNDLLLVVLAQANPNTAALLSAPSARSAESPAERRGRARLSSRQLAEIEDLYVRGWSTRRIARHFDIGKTTVLNVLKRREVELRPQGRTT